MPNWLDHPGPFLRWLREKRKIYRRYAVGTVAYTGGHPLYLFLLDTLPAESLIGIDIEIYDGRWRLLGWGVGTDWHPLPDWARAFDEAVLQSRSGKHPVIRVVDALRAMGEPDLRHARHCHRRGWEAPLPFTLTRRPVFGR